MNVLIIGDEYRMFQGGYDMEFSYQTRQKYADACVGEWEKQHPLKRKLLSRELCDLMEEIQTLGTSADNRAKKIEQLW